MSENEDQPEIVPTEKSDSSGSSVCCGADIRRAIEPVADWFDIDGEEGEPMDLVEVVSEISQMLADERQHTLKLTKALNEKPGVKYSPNETDPLFVLEFVEGLLIDLLGEDSEDVEQETIKRIGMLVANSLRSNGKSSNFPRLFACPDCGRMVPANESGCLENHAIHSTRRMVMTECMGSGKDITKRENTA